ncbi:hypothetical protein GCM10010232_11020 [Streptomyces amakusaensis]|uniref:Uncharacterized protein n=1 Tax=Streptomyces amakusaensis TaxID=67271 RepID=A0ABW0AB60_9ACTN
MTGMVFQVARSALKELCRLIPVEADASGKVIDILDPPSPLEFSGGSPVGTLHGQIIVRSLDLWPEVGTDRTVLHLAFDESWVELRGTDRSASPLAGALNVSFTLMFRRIDAEGGGSLAQLCADLGSCVVKLDPDPASDARIDTAAQPLAGWEVVAAAEAALTDRFRELGQLPAGFALTLAEGRPSERLTTVSALPTVHFADVDTLRVLADYGPATEAAAAPDELPLRRTVLCALTPPGFQQTVRNPAVRAMVRSMVADRHYAEYIGKAATPEDEKKGARLLGEYLDSEAGRQELAANTPPPVGTGALVRHVPNVPDPFSDFDVLIDRIELSLGDGRINGELHAHGEVNNFGLRARVGISAVPVVSQNRVELSDFQVGEPDVDVSLPFVLEWASGILTDILAGPIAGVLAPILLSAVANEIADSLLTAEHLSLDPEELAEQGPSLAGLPRGMSFSTLTVTPALMRLDGYWTVYVEDPRPFFPDVHITGRLTQEEEPEALATGQVWLECRPIIGVVMAVDRPTAGSVSFEYDRHTLHATVELALSPRYVPGPFTYSPWTLRVGYRDTYGYRDAVGGGETYPLEPGVLEVTSLVWLPEPPLHGTVEQRTFPVTVRGDHQRLELDLPAEAANVVLFLETEVTDGLGRSWKPTGSLDVQNLTVDLGSAFADYQKECAGTRRTLRVGRKASLKDMVTRESLAEAVQHAIRVGDPALVAQVESIGVRHGFRAVAESMAARLRHG